MNARKKHRSLVLFIILPASFLAFSLAMALPAFAAQDERWWIPITCPCWDGTTGHYHHCQNVYPYAYHCDTFDGDTHCQFGVSVDPGLNCENAPN